MHHMRVQSIMELQVSANVMASMTAGLATQLDRGPLCFIYMHTFKYIYNIIINPDFFKAAWHFSRLLETPSMRATCFPTLAKAHVTAVKQEPKSPKPAQTKAKEVLGMNRIRTCLAYFHLLYNMHKIHRRDRCIYNSRPS